MTIKIEEEEGSSYDPTDPNNHSVFGIELHGHGFRTTVTASPNVAASWVQDRSTQPLVVGLHTERRPNMMLISRGAYENNGRVATLQLSVESHCLMFQLLHARSIPDALKSFLSGSGHTFYGVGIHEDVRKLQDEYELAVDRAVDLGQLAGMREAGLKELAEQVLGLEFVAKPPYVAISKWDEQLLSAEQILYASMDAYVSFLLGKAMSN